MESNSVCDHTSDDNKIGRPRNGSPICLSRVWLYTELDDTKSYYQLIIKITSSEKKRIPRYGKVKFALKVLTLFLWWLKPRMWLVDLNYITIEEIGSFMINPNMTYITLVLKLSASFFVVVFWLVLPFRKGGIIYGLVKRI